VLEKQGNCTYASSEWLFTKYDLTDDKNHYGNVICHEILNYDSRSMMKKHYLIPNLEFNKNIDEYQI